MDTNRTAECLIGHATIQSLARLRAIAYAIGALLEQIQIWCDRAEQRRSLAALSDHQLKDIGLSRADAMREFVKPFWRT